MKRFTEFKFACRSLFMLTFNHFADEHAEPQQKVRLITILNKLLNSLQCFNYGQLLFIIIYYSLKKN